MCCVSLGEEFSSTCSADSSTDFGRIGKSLTHSHTHTNTTATGTGFSQTPPSFAGSPRTQILVSSVVAGYDSPCSVTLRMTATPPLLSSSILLQRKNYTQTHTRTRKNTQPQPHKPCIIKGETVFKDLGQDTSLLRCVSPCNTSSELAEEFTERALQPNVKWWPGLYGC